MEAKEKVLSEKRKHNMRLYSVHRMLTADLLFYYAVEFIFLTQVKGLSAGDIVLASAFFGIFKVISQIPATILIDKIGNKKGTILSDLVSIISVIIVMLCTNLITLIISNLVLAIAVSLKEVAENEILNKSIPNVEKKNKIFSKIDSKGVGNFYYIAAISAIIAGFLYDINPYIPMSLCIVVLLIAIRVASMFSYIDTEKNDENLEDEISQMYGMEFKNLKSAFSFMINSERMKSLMLFAGFIYSLIIVMNTLEMGLLKEIELSATNIGIIYALMQVVAGISSKQYKKMHDRFKNKTLTVIGVSYALACLLAGVAAIFFSKFGIAIFIIVMVYAIRYIDTAVYNMIIKKYLTNFINTKMFNKINAAYGIVTGLGSAIIGSISAYIVYNNSIKNSIIIIGAIAIVIITFILKFMEKRVRIETRRI